MADTRVLNNRYTLEAEVGRGGMGVVYRAEDAQVKRTVAIKTLPSIMTHNPELMRRFNSEVQHASKLSHPNIARVYDVGEDAGTHYYVMQYIDGKSLRELLIEKSRFTLEEALPILEQVASALDYAHSQGIVHRDIKPENILLDQADNAFVVDFGIAKAAEGTRTTRGMLGTPEYMSPEQIRGEAVDGRSDQYSLAVVAYEMLTGRTPFQTEGDDPWAQINQHLATAPPDPRQQCNELSVNASNALLLALEKGRNERFADCQTLINGLAGKTVVTAKRSRSRTAPALICGTVGILVILSVLMLLGGKDKRLHAPFANTITSIELVYAANVDGMLTLYGKTLDGRIDRRLNVTIPGKVIAYRVSPDGSHIVYQNDEGVYAWSRADNKSSFLCKADTVEFGNYSDKSQYFIYAVNGNAYRVDTLSDEVVSVEKASAASLSGSGDAIVYAVDKQVYLKNMHSGKSEMLCSAKNAILHLVSSSDTNTIAFSDKFCLYLYENGKVTEIQREPPHLTHTESKLVRNPNGYSDGRGYYITVEIQVPCDCTELVERPYLSSGGRYVLYGHRKLFDRKSKKVIDIADKIKIDNEEYSVDSFGSTAVPVVSPDSQYLYTTCEQSHGQTYVLSIRLSDNKMNLVCPGSMPQFVTWTMDRQDYSSSIIPHSLRPMSVPIYVETRSLKGDFDKDGSDEVVSYADIGRYLDGSTNGLLWVVDDDSIVVESKICLASMMSADINGDSYQDIIVSTPMTGSGCYWDCKVFSYQNHQLKDVWSIGCSPRSGKDVLIQEKNGKVNIITVEAIDGSMGYGTRQSRFKATYTVWRHGTLAPTKSVETIQQYESVGDALKELKITGKSLCPSS